jgi:deoxyhypusine monooxygenase
MTVDIVAVHDSCASLAQMLKNPKEPLHKRFRALFGLKALNTPESIDAIAACFTDPSDLLKHELAYVLGQMKNPYALKHLEQVLRDRQQVSMVRHEAAEAMGAIGEMSSLDTLKEFLSDEDVIVRETCELAVDKIELEHAKKVENPS